MWTVASGIASPMRGEGSGNGGVKFPVDNGPGRDSPKAVPYIEGQRGSRLAAVPLKIAASDHLDDTRFRARVRTGGECGSHPLFGDLTKAVCLDERHLLIPGRCELNTHLADTPCGTWDGAGPALTEPISRYRAVLCWTAKRSSYLARSPAKACLRSGQPGPEPARSSWSSPAVRTGSASV